ncbi:SNF2 superfamily protein [Colletotrichum tabaci]|uniref:SNF2 superfamily protein n=1 Tax=Colletotrichum tabaci TaxID=1209068 RepID=A0AAV9TAT2_9PEZI
MADQEELDRLEQLRLYDPNAGQGLAGDQSFHEEADLQNDPADGQYPAEPDSLHEHHTYSTPPAYNFGDAENWVEQNVSGLDRVAESQSLNDFPTPFPGFPSQQHSSGAGQSYDSSNTNQTESAQGVAPEADMDAGFDWDNIAQLNQSSLYGGLAPMAQMSYESNPFPPEQQSSGSYQPQPAENAFFAQDPGNISQSNQLILDPALGGENPSQNDAAISSGIGSVACNIMTSIAQAQYRTLATRRWQAILQLHRTIIFLANPSARELSTLLLPLCPISFRILSPLARLLVPELERVADAKRYPAPSKPARRLDPRMINTSDVQSLLGAHAQPGKDINMLAIFSTPEKLLDVIIDAFVMENIQVPAPGSVPPQFGLHANRREGAILDERAVHKPRDAFPIIYHNASKLGFAQVVEQGGVSFRIATMCSGTDGPILALRELAEAATGDGHPGALKYDHVFSVEIDPVKQGWIARNAHPSGHIFRNVADLGRPGAYEAMSVTGAMEKIPKEVDILIAGSSCVDFSSLNIRREDRKKASGLQKLFDQFQERGVSDVLRQDDPVAEEVVEGLEALFDKIEEEKGESTKTFLSILLYALQHRPKILILENVTKAPWDQFKGFWLPAIGYSAAVAQVDSKNFLVPQTRQRKYLVAVDARRYGQNASEIVESWAELMKPSHWFKNPPDLEGFLLPPSDKRTLNSRFQLERAMLSKPKKDVEAVVCQNDHRLARRKEGLGNGQPYTRLDDRGNVQPREESWGNYIRLITGRMQDLLDISSLRASEKNFDFIYKLVMLDLGQNVDRQSIKIGTIPCIIPTNESFSTYHGRPILGIECLALQGIPIDRVSISVEKEAQLKDLAGNAMTTTVAGAAILCAIACERKFVLEALESSSVYIAGLSTVAPIAGPASFLFGLRHVADEAGGAVATVGSAGSAGSAHLLPPATSSFVSPPVDNPIDNPVNEAKMSWQDVEPEAIPGELTVGSLTDLCRKGRRNCLCDDFRKHQHTGTHWRCDDCDEVRCESCAGNPDHNFDKDRPIDVTCAIDKSAAYELAAAALPGHLVVDWFDPNIDVLDGLSDEIFGRHRAALQVAIRACCSSKNYYQTSLKFRDDLTVTYESEFSYITVVVTEKGLTWNVHLRQTYLDIGHLSMEPNEATQNAALLLNSLGYDVSKPLLRAVISDPDLYIQQEIGFQILQTPMRFASDSGPSDGMRQQMLDVPDYPQLQYQIADDIDGDFRHTKSCGTPFGLLYTRKDGGRSRVYHMLHANRTTPAEDDRWVLTKNPRKLEPDQSRDIICNFAQDYVHFLCGENPDSPRRVSATVPGVWKFLQPEYHLAVAERHSALTVRFCNPMEQAADSDNCQSTLPSVLVRMENTHMHYSVRSLPVQWAAPAHPIDANHEPWVSVAPHEAKDALALFSPALNKIKDTSQVFHQARCLAANNIPLDVEAARCDCLPEPAKVLHRWDENGNIERIEDQQTAARTDRDLQQRPAPYKIQAYMNPDVGGSGRLSILNFRLLLSPKVLAHRGLAHFPPRNDAMSALVRSPRGSGTFDVQFEFVDPSLKELRPLKESMLPVKRGDFPLDNPRQPPNFARNQMNLRRDQWEAVQWMLKREHAVDPFLEKEFEECLLPSVNVRLWGTATLENLSHCGVLAHDIGYGKTVVTLGLVDFSTADAANEAKSIDERAAHLGANCLIHLKATLVIVPPHIVGQWANEAARFVGRDSRGHGSGLLTVHVITKPTDIVREKMIVADIIIVSTNFVSSDKNLEKLAAVSKLPPIHHRKSALKGQDHRDWYSEATETIRQSGFDFLNPDSMDITQLDTVLQNRRNGTNDWIQMIEDNNVGPSDRKTQTTSAKKRAGASKPSSKAKVVTAIDVLEAFKKGQLLEMYTFQRAVLDEFSYENTPVAVFLEKVVASAKWILSGTPPTVDLGRICDIGTLLNVHVARAAPSMPGYFPNVTMGPRISEQTDAEKYRSYAEPLSAKLAVERHEQAKSFILHHFRKNKTDVDNVQVEELLCFAPMQPLEATIYNLVQQGLYDAKFDIHGIPSQLSLLVHALLADEKLASTGSKVKASGKSVWAEAIDALLLLASVPSWSNRQGFINMSWIKDGQILSFRSISRYLAYGSAMFLEHCSSAISSLFDQMMYLANVLGNDETPRSSTLKAKKAAYMGHMHDIIDIFKHEKAEIAGDRQLIMFLREAIINKTWVSGRKPYQEPEGRDLWDIKTWSMEDGGGPGSFTAANWWIFEEGMEISDEELSVLKARWHRPDIDGPADTREEIIQMIRAKQLNPVHPLHDALPHTMGLKHHTHLEDDFLFADRFDKHVAGKLTKDDFEFGIQLPKDRPHKGRMIRPRGQPIDEVLNCFMLVIQSIQAGIKTAATAWRNQMFILKADCLQNHNFDAHNSLPIRCSQCHKTTDRGLQSIACGHTLCYDCHLAFTESQHRTCPTKGCQATSQGSFMPWDTFFKENDADGVDEFDADVSGLSGSKMLEIEKIILTDLEDDEKAIVFAPYSRVKEAIRVHLFRSIGDNVAVYVTNGSEMDSEIIEDFKNFPGKAVLVQNLMSSESAGTNLTEANHVIFAGVLFTDSDNYTMYMDQAKGRVIRQGQTRKVTIYHLVSPATLEFDIFNQRQGGRIRGSGDLDGRIRLPVSEKATVDPAYPLRYRSYLESSAVEKLLRSVEFVEFEG